MAAAMIQYVTVGDKPCCHWTTHSMSRTRCFSSHSSWTWKCTQRFVSFRHLLPISSCKSACSRRWSVKARNLGGRAAANLAGRILDDEVDLMQKTPDAQDLVDGLLDHQRDEHAEPAHQRVLAIRADQHQLDPPQGTEMIE
ncbi:unnamed protein product [Sphagnum troendelagicum]|uniref:Uncharacterized protein n=1 Tax=Sphagnum troendelagicum TaxID=128251 RepID=A0ABP0UYD4_9BRYO